MLLMTSTDGWTSGMYCETIAVMVLIHHQQQQCSMDLQLTILQIWAFPSCRICRKNSMGHKMEDGYVIFSTVYWFYFMSARPFRSKRILYRKWLVCLRLHSDIEIDQRHWHLWEFGKKENSWSPRRVCLKVSKKMSTSAFCYRRRDFRLYTSHH